MADFSVEFYINVLAINKNRQTVTVELGTEEFTELEKKMQEARAFQTKQIHDTIDDFRRRYNNLDSEAKQAVVKALFPEEGNHPW